MKEKLLAQNLNLSFLPDLQSLYLSRVNRAPDRRSEPPTWSSGNPWRVCRDALGLGGPVGQTPSGWLPTSLVVIGWLVRFFAAQITL